MENFGPVVLLVAFNAFTFESSYFWFAFPVLCAVALSRDCYAFAQNRNQRHRNLVMPRDIVFTLCLAYLCHQLPYSPPPRVLLAISLSILYAFKHQWFALPALLASVVLLASYFYHGTLADIVWVFLLGIYSFSSCICILGVIAGLEGKKKLFSANLVGNLFMSYISGHHFVLWNFLMLFVVPLYVTAAYYKHRNLNALVMGIAAAVEHESERRDVILHYYQLAPNKHFTGLVGAYITILIRLNQMYSRSEDKVLLFNLAVCSVLFVLVCSGLFASAIHVGILVSAVLLGLDSMDKNPEHQFAILCACGAVAGMHVAFACVTKLYNGIDVVIWALTWQASGLAVVAVLGGLYYIAKYFHRLLEGYYEFRPFVPCAMCNALTPYQVPIYGECSATVSNEMQQALQFCDLFNKTSDLLAQAELVSHGFDQHETTFSEIEDCINLLQVNTHKLGYVPFTSLPTEELEQWINARDESRKQLVKKAKHLRDMFSNAPANHAFLKRELAAMMGVLLRFLVCCPVNMVAANGCLEKDKMDMIAQEIAQLDQTAASLGKTNAARVLELNDGYVRITRLCKVNTEQMCSDLLSKLVELNAMDEVTSFALLEQLDHLAPNDVIQAHETIQTNLACCHAILNTAMQLKLEYLGNQKQILAKEMEALYADGVRLTGVEREMNKLKQRNTVILQEKQVLEQEMQRLCDFGHFPEMSNRIDLIWKSKTAGLASVREQIQALLSDSFDLKIHFDMGQFKAPTPPMQRALRSSATEGKVLVDDEGKEQQVVLKMLAPRDGMIDIIKLRSVLHVTHNSILRCLGGVFADTGNVRLVFPFLPGGNLKQWAEMRARATGRKIDVLAQASDAIALLHRMNVYHGNLKLANIVMVSQEDDAVPKLNDFQCNTGHESSDEAQDVRAFASLASELIAIRGAGDGLVNESLHGLLVQPPATIKLLYLALSTRHCVVCFDDAKQLKDGVMCPDGAHYICQNCFDGLVTHELTTELGRRRESVCCPQCDKPNRAFPPLSYSHRIELATRATRELTEKNTREQLEEERQRQETEAKMLAPTTLAVHQAIELLTSRCPRCAAAFYDFEQCAALTCANCNIQFCAFCHQGAAENAHPHVLRCELNPERERSMFCSKEDYERQQTRMKRAKVHAYLQGLPPHIADVVRGNPTLREYL